MSRLVSLRSVIRIYVETSESSLLITFRLIPEEEKAEEEAEEEAAE